MPDDRTEEIIARHIRSAPPLNDAQLAALARLFAYRDTEPPIAAADVSIPRPRRGDDTWHTRFHGRSANTEDRHEH